MTDFKPGDRVRVTAVEEAEVAMSTLFGGLTKIRLANGDEVFASSVLVTKLPDPEPEWRIGHVVKDAEGICAYWSGAGFERVCPPGGWLLELTRPLTIIGAPVEE